MGPCRQPPGPGGPDPRHVLTNDTGGAPQVSLFSKHDPEKYAPSALKLKIVDAKQYGGKDPELIPVADVLDAVEAMQEG